MLLTIIVALILVIMTTTILAWVTGVLLEIEIRRAKSKNQKNIATNSFIKKREMNTKTDKEKASKYFN